MAKKNKLNKTSKWRHHYRMVVLNDDTFEERFSLKLNRLNVFVVLCLSAVFLIAITTLLIAFTPLREFIPGYSSSKLSKQTVMLTQTADSLRVQLAVNEQQYTRIKKVLSGDLTAQEYAVIDSVARAETTIENPDLSPIKEDSLLRVEVAREDKYNVIQGATALTNFVFFPPIKGAISDSYNIENKHYAVDITAPIDTPVKAAADGTVVFSGWSVDTGNTILIEHAYGMITVYKHCATRTKEQNDQVLSGEVIASVGNTGTLTTGPHLHFEIWVDGYPVDPAQFISFN